MTSFWPLDVVSCYWQYSLANGRIREEDASVIAGKVALQVADLKTRLKKLY